MPAAGISFANVSYTLPTGRALLRDINLKLEAGTTTAILGRSGSGKTTLLRMVNALVDAHLRRGSASAANPRKPPTRSTSAAASATSSRKPASSPT